MTISEIFEYVGARFLGAHGMGVLRVDDHVGAQKQGCWIGRLERRRAMRTGKWNTILSGVCGFVAAVGMVTASAHADVTTEKGSSILVFPKVRADANFDTIIEITNTGNSMVHAHCYYVNDLQEWNEIDFNIWLTKQQPTQWVVSSGRRFDPSCGFGESCSGFAPGLVPPTPEFEGILMCVEVTETGEPFAGNHLKGVATLVATNTDTNDGVDSRVDGDISAYNAVGIQAEPDAIPGNPLLLDGSVYESCPERIVLDHVTSGAQDLVVPASETLTDLTLVPCSQDFETQTPASTTLQFVVYNEYEQRFSASTTVECFMNVEISQIDTSTTPNNSVFSADVLGTDVANAVITPVPGNGGVIALAERVVRTSSGAGRAAYNVHGEGSLVPSGGPDSIRLVEPF